MVIFFQVRPIDKVIKNIYSPVVVASSFAVGAAVVVAAAAAVACWARPFPGEVFLRQVERSVVVQKPS